MLTYDLKNLVSKNIAVTIDRKKGVRRYEGRLLIVSKSFICLEILKTGRQQWVQKPNKFYDKVTLVKEVKV